jgi:hypothetical protein
MCRGFFFCRRFIEYVISLAATAKLGITCKAVAIKGNVEHYKHGGYPQICPQESCCVTWLICFHFKYNYIKSSSLLSWKR